MCTVSHLDAEPATALAWEADRLEPWIHFFPQDGTQCGPSGSPNFLCSISVWYGSPGLTSCE